MIGTEFIKGQGLGNQLFSYVSARCIARDLGYGFGTAGQEQLAVNIHSKKGMYFMDMDLGVPITDKGQYQIYQEKEDRLYLKTCVHDMTHGCYVADADEDLYNIGDQTLIYGNLQAEKYFRAHKEAVKVWLKVKKEYDSYQYTKDNLCIINIRGGEYTDNRALFLRRKYWLDAMKNMRSIRADMEFMIVTDDVEAAGRILPGLAVSHGELAQDYVTLKNARYLILSNSSFAFFPAYTSETAVKIIAPKYWARHNVSDGYWASGQNIYECFSYQDRQGRLFNGEECRREWENYKKRANFTLGEKKYTQQEVKRQGQKDRALYWADKVAGRLKRML